MNDRIIWFGLSIRFIQAMLGHANLTTTQIYTHVAIRQLREIHRATHPARLEKKTRQLLDSIKEEASEDPEDA